jgi:hypothetical protein
MFSMEQLSSPRKARLALALYVLASEDVRGTTLILPLSLPRQKNRVEYFHPFERKLDSCCESGNSFLLRRDLDVGCLFTFVGDYDSDETIEDE